MTERVYELLWDCSSCGTAGLLGKSQRRCPNCGAPQDPTKRYFPKPGQAVEVSGHRFVGADWACTACSTPNGAAAAFCMSCGNPKDGNPTVGLRGDRIVRNGVVVSGDEGPSKKTTSPAPAPPAPRSKAPLLLAAAALGLATLLALTLVKRDAVVNVTAHTWWREIDIERFDAVRDSSWCDAVPMGAYNMSRHREVRAHRQVPDGQECHERHVDRGDGTFSIKTECTTKYRSEPIYDDKCSYDIDRWHVVRTVRNDGDLRTTPSWPVTAVRGGVGRGAEREGSRRERYTLHLQEIPSQKRHECVFSENTWRSIPDGSRHSIQVRLVGAAVCETLSP